MNRSGSCPHAQGTLRAYLVRGRGLALESAAPGSRPQTRSRPLNGLDRLCVSRPALSSRRVVVDSVRSYGGTNEEHHSAAVSDAQGAGR
jgi:hypothetical protein